MSRKARIYNFKHRDHLDVISLVNKVVQETRSANVDGLMVMIAEKNGRVTRHMVAGSLSNIDRAHRHAFRFQLATAMQQDYDEE